MVQPIPQGFSALTPHLSVSPCKEAIAFYERAFGAKLHASSPMPGTDLLIHAQMDIQGAIFMLADVFPQWGGTGPKDLKGSCVTLHLYVDDVDAWMKRAEENGATIAMPAADMFWGDRYGKIIDPFGHHWSIATHIADPTPEEMEAAMKAMMGP